MGFLGVYLWGCSTPRGSLCDHVGVGVRGLTPHGSDPFFP